MCGISSTLDDMQEVTNEIANRVRGVAAEKRFTQKRIADTLGIARSSVNLRVNGQTPFTAGELWVLANALGVDVRRFYPERIAEASAA